MTDTARVTEMISSLRAYAHSLAIRNPDKPYRFITVGRAPENPNAILVTTGHDLIEDCQAINHVLIRAGLRNDNCKFRWNHSGSITLTSF